MGFRGYFVGFHGCFVFFRGCLWVCEVPLDFRFFSKISFVCFFRVFWLVLFLFVNISWYHTSCFFHGFSWVSVEVRGVFGFSSRFFRDSGGFC